MSQTKKTNSDAGYKNKSSYKNMSTYVILFLALFSIAFFGVCNPQGMQSSLSGVAGSVAGDEITKSEFTRVYTSNSDRFRQIYGEQFNPSALKLAQKTLDQLVTSKIFYLEAGSLGVNVSLDEVVDRLMDEKFFQDENGRYSNEKFKKYLVNAKLTEARFLEDVQRDLSLQKLQRLIFTTSFASKQAIDWEYRLKEMTYKIKYLNVDASSLKIKVSQEEIDNYLKQASSEAKVKQWYESHQSEYNQEAQVKASHILISYKNARNASASVKNRSKEEARKRAHKLHKRLIKNKEVFSEVARKETDEPNGKTSGGDLGFFTFDSMAKAFSEAAFKLKVGSVSDIVETPFGFHIIKVTAKKPKKEITLAEATPSIVKQMIKREKAPEASEKLAAKIIADRQTETKLEKLLAKHELKWEETEAFSATAQYIPGMSATPELFNAIVSLSKKGQFYEYPIQYKRGSYYIIKLVNRVLPDMSTVDDKTLKQVGQELASTEGSFFFNVFRKNSEKKYKDANKIYLNPQYLALDNPAKEDS